MATRPAQEIRTIEVWSSYLLLGALLGAAIGAIPAFIDASAASTYLEVGGFLGMGAGGLFVVSMGERARYVLALGRVPLTDEREITRERLTKLRKPAWRGFWRRALVATLGVVGAWLLLMFAPINLATGFLAIYLLSKPADALQAVGGAAERLLAAALWPGLFLTAVWVFSRKIPPEAGDLWRIGVICLVGIVVGEVGNLRRDFKLLKTPEFFNVD